MPAYSDEIVWGPGELAFQGTACTAGCKARHAWRAARHGMHGGLQGTACMAGCKARHAWRGARHGMHGGVQGMACMAGCKAHAIYIIKVCYILFQWAKRTAPMHRLPLRKQQGDSHLPGICTAAALHLPRAAPCRARCWLQ
eukprot:363690-Chlamydomonas_euryale.AAC.1